jgi:V8-like Glu-specific endopeptidase
MNQNLLDVYLGTIGALVETSKIEEALNALRDLDRELKADLWQSVILASGEYYDAQNMFNQGILTNAEFDQKRRRVRYVLTELMKEAPRNIALNARLKGLAEASRVSVLSGDEKKLEKLIGPANTLLRISWLAKGLDASKAVCRIVTADGRPVGTGFMTDGGYLFTNNHVINTKQVAQQLRAEFNYEFGLDNKLRERTLYEFDPSDFITSGQDELDFTRIKVVDKPDTPLRQWGIVEFAPDAIPAVSDPVNIIQHPNGQDKQIALNANEVMHLDGRFLHYAADTLPGSSGSPVFNQQWKVVALHHAGVNVTINGVSKPANEGVLFRDIFKFIGGQSTSGGQAGGNTRAESITTPASDPKPVAPTVPDTAPAPGQAPKFVVAYHLADQAICDNLNDYFYLLKKKGKMSVYNVHSDALGDQVVDNAKVQLQTAHYVLALVTKRFLASEWLDFCLQSGKKIIPIRVADVDLRESGLEGYAALPTQNRTIQSFGNEDEAFTNVVNEIRRLLPA